MRNLAIALPLAFLFAATAAVQDDPAGLLKRVAETYATLPKTTYSFEQLEVREFSGSMQNRTEQRERFMGAEGKFRQEQLPNGVLRLFDGQYRWAYNPGRNEYTKEGVTSAVGHPPSFGMIQSATRSPGSARLLRQENLDLASGPVMCQVIEVGLATTAPGLAYSLMTLWVDASRNLVVKLRYRYAGDTAAGQSPSETTVTDEFTKAAIGGPVDEALLRFTPHAGAVQVERLIFAPKSPLLGKDCPDFELQGADGKTISSASLRGHPTLLQFGQGPDDEMLPFLEMTYRSLKGKGLAAYFVLQPRNRPGTGTEAYSVPVATDSTMSVANKFGLSYRGSVLVDAKGKIAYVGTTVQNSQELARALQTAGVW